MVGAGWQVPWLASEVWMQLSAEPVRPPLSLGLHAPLAPASARRGGVGVAGQPVGRRSPSAQGVLGKPFAFANATSLVLHTSPASRASSRRSRAAPVGRLGRQ